MPLEYMYTFFPRIAPIFLLPIALAVIWEMVWKCIALWRSGRNGHLVWFIAIFIFNTLGILPIIYILAFSRRKDGSFYYEEEEIINE